MKFTDKDETRVVSSTLDFEKLFIDLITFDGIKYDDFYKNPNNYKDLLEGKAGVYHFFSKHQKKATSLYVGKGGLGAKNKWDIFKRLNHHRRKSQHNTLHGAIAKDFGIDNKQAINFLCSCSVYIQYIILSDDSNEEDVLDLENYCKYRLNPKYTER